MKIAIHHRENSFSERWIEYCKQNNINYIIVDCYHTEIIETLKKENVTHLMWHLDHSSQKNLMVFPYVMNSIENLGIKTFPNFNTRWHFDDKVAQKYLLESIEAPLVSSFVFYKEEEAIKHIKTVSFPIVAKLKRGAGATNVKLLNNEQEAINYIKKMFTIGINPNAGTLGNLDQKIRIAKKIQNPVMLLRKVLNHINKNRNELKVSSNEKGYFYYQEFMPNNAYDTRVIIVGDKAVAFKRLNREGDFRASGSGKASYDDIDINMIKIAFETSKHIGAQSLAYDFVYDKNRVPKIIEICFGFGTSISSSVPFYWDDNLNYCESKLNLQFEMMKTFLK